VSSSPKNAGAAQTGSAPVTSKESLVGGPRAKLYAGTSGYSYPSWKPGFYPKEVPSTKFLNYYATRLNLVEINYTFRQLAKASTFEKWLEATPRDFLFSPKAHNKITHILRLKDAQEFTRVFLESLEPLRAAGRLGPVLFQLPPNLKADRERLRDFVRLLPKSDRYAFEFRNESWFVEDIFTTLRGCGCGLCFAESEERETPEVLTSDFVYYRLRKPEYSDEEIAAISAKVAEHIRANRIVYALFKHEETPAGALYAERLLKQVSSVAA
jgi:uncharacterized protein YecE (DUF72 family)